jgi:hypothetical protein
MRMKSVFAAAAHGAQVFPMLRLRTVVLLWVARRLWLLIRPALERRLRTHRVGKHLL